MADTAAKKLFWGGRRGHSNLPDPVRTLRNRTRYHGREICYRGLQRPPPSVKKPPRDELRSTEDNGDADR